MQQLTLKQIQAMTEEEVKAVPAEAMPRGTEVFAYCRHSPGDNQTIESQEMAVKEYCEKKGWVIKQIFLDRGTSGGTFDRDEFNYMMYLALQKKRPADVLVIWSFARFGREAMESTYHRTRLKLHGWKIESMTDEVPHGKLAIVIEAIIDYANQSERDIRQIETIRGLRSIAQLDCVPNGQVALGYNIEQKHIGTYSVGKNAGKPRMGRKPVVDPELAPKIQRAFEMKAQGATYKVLSKELGLFDNKPGSWNAFFSNKVYIGQYEFRGEPFPNVYPAIITKELFDAVQATIPKRKNKMIGRNNPRRKHPSSYFIRSVAICGECGAPMIGSGVKKYRYYICSEQKRNVENCPNSQRIDADYVEEKIFDFLTNLIVSQDYLDDLLEWTNNNLNSNLDNLILRLEVLKKQHKEEDALEQSYTENFGKFGEQTEKMKNLISQQHALVASLVHQISNLEFEIANSRVEATSQDISFLIENLQYILANADYFDLRNVIETFCPQIIMTSDRVDVQISFPINGVKNEWYYDIDSD